MRKDLHGLASKNHRGETSAAVRRHDDEVTAALQGGVDYGLLGMFANRVRRIDEDARGTGVG